jgi:hypothetical protein
MRFFPFLEPTYTVNIPGADLMSFYNLPLLKSKLTPLTTIPATLKSIIHYILIRYGLERIGIIFHAVIWP